MGFLCCYFEVRSFVGPSRGLAPFRSIISQLQPLLLFLFTHPGHICILSKSMGLVVGWTGVMPEKGKRAGSEDDVKWWKNSLI